ncbi:hypothetical protein M1O56_05745 [Dehalococcoidia bacterium]|nr:hypothetical protein [Dehalococcoidia bacterium]
MTIKTSRTIWRLPELGARGAMGGFSAIVIVQGVDVWAEDAYGRIIAEGKAGVDDTEVLRKAVGRGSGRVLVRGNLILTEQVNVWGGVALDVETGYYLRNELVDGWTPCLAFKQYSGINRLAINCNGKSGILVGEEGKVNLIKAEFINLWHVGKIFDAVKGPQTGIKFQGFAFHVDFINVYGGNVGCDFVGCSDAFVDATLLVDFITGMRFSGSEHLFLTQVDLDSGNRVGIQIDSSRDINISGVIWVNNTAHPGASLIHGALVGEFSSETPNTSLHLKLKFLRHGGTALKLSHTEDSIFDIEISNATLFTVSPPIAAGIEFGIGLSGDIVLRSDRYIDAPTKVSGTPYGKLLIPRVGYNSGTATFSGDGVATSFTFAHGLANTPTVVHLEAKSADASGDKFWSADSVNITVTFVTAPPAGINNVILGWEAKIS